MLRHTAASQWLSAGLNPAKVAAYLGDTLEIVLTTYAHFMPGDDDRARAIMDLFFEPTLASAPDVPRAAPGLDGRRCGLPVVTPVLPTVVPAWHVHYRDGGPGEPGSEARGHASRGSCFI